MKHFKHLLLVTLGLLLCLSGQAETFKYGNVWYYVLTSFTVSVRSGDYSGDIVIPEKVTNNGVTYTVTEIGSHYGGFSDATQLTSISMPNTIEVIGSMAFENCTGLTSVVIPSSVTSIGDDAFKGCTGLTTLTIPSNVSSIGYYAFSECINLTSVVIEEGVTILGPDMFRNCTKLSYVSLPNSLTDISFSSFENCTNLKSISIPDNVAKIDFDAFFNTGLDSIYIPASVTSISSNPFIGCKSLVSIKVSEDNPVYDSRNNCNAIIHTATNELVAGFPTTIIPDDVVSIGENAYGGQEDLTAIQIPASVTRIGSRAFNGCTSLTSISTLENVDSIGKWAFYGCSGLTSFVVPSKVKTIAEYLFEGCKNLSSISIPEGVTTIGGAAFDYCENLIDVNIPSTVTSIGWCAFLGCKEIRSIQIPEGVLSIGNRAFSVCASLKSIQIPEGVKSIDYSTFSGCSSLQHIILPNSLEEISSSAFGSNKSLQYIRVGQTPPIVSSSKFYDINTEMITLLVPTGSESAYKSAPAWNTFENIIAFDFFGSALEGVQLTISIINEDEKTAMITGTLDKSISGDLTIPAEINGYHIIAIGDGAFCDCTNLTKVSIPKTISSIGNLAFSGCTGLESIVSDIEVPFEVPDNAFESIANQTELTIPFETETLYRSTNGWKQFKRITEMIPPATDISQMDNVIYIADAKAIADDLQTMLVVKMKNNVTAAGFHFDLYLPDGCTFTIDDKGRPNAKLSDKRTDSNIKLTTPKLNSDGSLMIEAHSGNASVISGEDGPILMVPIIVAEGTEVGDNHVIYVKNWGISDELGNTLPQPVNPTVIYRLTVIPNIRGDVNGNNVKFIESSDFVALIRYLMELPHVELNTTATDANGDGIIDIGDLTAISNLKKYGSISRPVNNTTEVKSVIFTTPIEAE